MANFHLEQTRGQTSTARSSLIESSPATAQQAYTAATLAFTTIDSTSECPSGADNSIGCSALLDFRRRDWYHLRQAAWNQANPAGGSDDQVVEGFLNPPKGGLINRLLVIPESTSWWHLDEADKKLTVALMNTLPAFVSSGRDHEASYPAGASLAGKRRDSRLTIKTFKPFIKNEWTGPSRPTCLKL
jgi:hypothetical protein